MWFLLWIKKSYIFWTKQIKKSSFVSIFLSDYVQISKLCRHLQDYITVNSEDKLLWNPQISGFPDFCYILVYNHMYWSHGRTPNLMQFIWRISSRFSTLGQMICFMWPTYIFCNVLSLCLMRPVTWYQKHIMLISSVTTSVSNCIVWVECQVKVQDDLNDEHLGRCL